MHFSDATSVVIVLTIDLSVLRTIAPGSDSTCAHTDDNKGGVNGVWVGYGGNDCGCNIDIACSGLVGDKCGGLRNTCKCNHHIGREEGHNNKSSTLCAPLTSPPPPLIQALQPCTYTATWGTGARLKRWDCLKRANIDPDLDPNGRLENPFIRTCSRPFYRHIWD
jgi:hypothetical protein